MWVLVKHHGGVFSQQVPESGWFSFKSLGGRLAWEKAFREAGAVLCKGLEAGEHQKHAENRESKYPAPHCSVLLSRSEPAPHSLPSHWTGGKTQSGRGRPGVGNPRQVSGLFLLPTPRHPGPLGFSSWDTEALCSLAMTLELPQD